MCSSQKSYVLAILVLASLFLAACQRRPWRQRLRLRFRLWIRTTMWELAASAARWLPDSSGYVYMFGGEGYAGSGGPYGHLNDVWRYLPFP